MKKIAMFTDIHFGKKSNSVLHNQDCLDFIEWFCSNVKADPKIDAIGFLGDWFESRSSINIQTLDMSYEGLKKLDALDIPIYFVVGNHDLHRRSTREIHSVNMFRELKNFTVIDEPTVIDGTLWSPFLFHSEYPELIQYTKNTDAWFGHFEFAGFKMTGYDFVLERGPDHKVYKNIGHIFAGHFHKRQNQDNVYYIGNTFPMEFGDVEDRERGMCIFDRSKKKVSFTNWADCPMYIRRPLSHILEKGLPTWKKMRVESLKDVDLTFTETQEVKEELMKLYELRELSIHEQYEQSAILEEGESQSKSDDLMKSENDIIVEALKSIEVETISGEYLSEIYLGLKTEC